MKDKRVARLIIKYRGYGGRDYEFTCDLNLKGIMREAILWQGDAEPDLSGVEVIDVSLEWGEDERD